MLCAEERVRPERNFAIERLERAPWMEMTRVIDVEIARSRAPAPEGRPEIARRRNPLDRGIPTARSPAGATQAVSNRGERKGLRTIGTSPGLPDLCRRSAAWTSTSIGFQGLPAPAIAYRRSAAGQASIATSMPSAGFAAIRPLRKSGYNLSILQGAMREDRRYLYRGKV